MAGVISALRPYDMESLGRKQIDDLALPFIPPLQSNNNDTWHTSINF
jgi:hypothetical protein